MQQEPKVVATVVEQRQVVFLIPSLQGGGAERVIATLLRHVDRTRFRVALAVVNMRDAVFLSDVPEDVELIDLGSSRVRYALPKIVRLIWKRRPDVVLSTLGHLNLALAIVRPFLPNDVRYVARETIMVSESLPLYRTTWLWSWGYRFFYRRFDMVICQTDVMRDDLVVNYRLPSGKAVVIHNPVDRNGSASWPRRSRPAPSTGQLMRPAVLRFNSVSRAVCPTRRVRSFSSRHWPCAEIRTCGLPSWGRSLAWRSRAASPLSKV